ncbi:histidine kinase N-terminal domain-containing protein [Oscillospiraceae bacterium PP1C4]
MSKHSTWVLCHKYTNLTEDEIACLQEWDEILPVLSNAEQSDAFIDCLTSSGKSAIVVCEAKPQSVPSSYSKPLLGMLIQWKNEPAVTRSMRLGVPTNGVKAVCVPENAQVVQTVEPIFFRERQIGVLIFEKQASLVSVSHKQIPQDQYVLSDDSAWLMQCVDEAVFMVDARGIVCFRNEMAQKLYEQLGYVNDILGMEYSNIFLDNLQVLSQEKGNLGDRIEVSLGNFHLLVKQILVNKNGITFAVVMQDITDYRNQEKELVLKSIAIQEMHHRIKNSLQKVADILSHQECYVKNPEALSVLQDTRNRVLTIAAAHQELMEAPEEKVQLCAVLERICDNTLKYASDPLNPVSIKLQGDDFLIDAEVASSIALVVNELVQNSIKHAFSYGKPGTITIQVTENELFSQIQICDDGKGFDVTDVQSKGLGLELVRNLVQEKLCGELSVSSDKNGTCVTFDFIG